MSYNKEKEISTEAAKPLKIRISMTSQKLKILEELSNDIVRSAKAKLHPDADFSNLSSKDRLVKGPIRLPTKALRISTRKTPNGEGSKTWDAYEMRIYKRIIHLTTTSELVKQITTPNYKPGVDIEITIAKTESD